MFSELPPIFIVGPPRSGTTLLLSLMQNDNYSVLPETHFFSVLTRDLKGEITGGNLDKMKSRFVHKFKTPFPFSDEVSLGDKKKAFLSLINEFRIERRRGFIEKTPRHVLFYDEIKNIFPDAKFICLVREPKNTIASMSVMVNGQKKMIFRLTLLYKKILMAIKKIHFNDDVFLVKYEDLVGGKRLDVFRSLNIFLGGNFVEERMDAEIVTTSILHGNELWKTNNKKHSHIRENDDQKWRLNINDSTGKGIDFLCKDTLSAFGYTAPGCRCWELPALFFKDFFKNFTFRELKTLLRQSWQNY